jgi:hypothetical protein
MTWLTGPITAFHSVVAIVKKHVTTENNNTQSARGRVQASAQRTAAQYFSR